MTNSSAVMSSVVTSRQAVSAVAGQVLGEAADIDITTLFTGGIAGYALDVSDAAFLKQDSAGSTAVTAPGQPVGRLLDVSGNNNVFTQATDIRRPTWAQDGNGFYHLDGNGVAQWMERSSVVVPAGVRKATVWLAVRRDISNKMWLLHSQLGTSGGIGAFLGAGNLNLNAKMSDGEVYAAGVANSVANIICIQYDNTTTTFGSNIRIRVNGAAASLTNVAVNTATDFITALHRIMAAFGTSECLDGGFYGAICRFAESTGSEISLGEQWLSQRCGRSI